MILGTCGCNFVPGVNPRRFLMKSTEVPPSTFCFLKMRMMDSFLTIISVKYIGQNVPTSWKISFVSHFLFRCFLTESFPPNLKRCILSSRRVLLYGREWWVARSNVCCMTQTRRNTCSRKFLLQELSKVAVPAFGTFAGSDYQSQPKLSTGLGIRSGERGRWQGTASHTLPSLSPDSQVRMSALEGKDWSKDSQIQGQNILSYWSTNTFCEQKSRG